MVRCAGREGNYDICGFSPTGGSADNRLSPGNGEEPAMSLDASAVTHVLVALAALMVTAHALGTVFARLHQPRVIGEIAAGLVLGPTLLGHAAPGVTARLFPATGATPAVLGAVYQVGLLLLLFCSGTQIRSAPRWREGRTVGWVFITGMLLPFLAGLAILRITNLRSFWGPQGNAASFLLIFAIAMAVTSIPVISKIMHDLDILDTAFARVVLGVAVAEDVVLYVVLAVALGLAQGSSGTLSGLPSVLKISPGSPADMTYHVLATLTVLGVALAFGPRWYRASAGWRLNLIRQASPVAYQLAFMFGSTLLCLFLGVEGFFGAFVAGLAVGTAEEGSPAAVEPVQSFAFAFFIPVYFAIIGLQLDLAHGFNIAFFVLFLLLACLIKAGSVYLGARLAGEAPSSSLNLAVALNARGGPGIVVASVAFGAGIIGQSFYATLVMLAIVTSLLAGSWLARVPRDRLLAGSPPAAHAGLATRRSSTGSIRAASRPPEAPR
jgi:Kef-type K+ transport system membrane component KefB